MFPHRIINWKQAIVLTVEHKVDVLETYEAFVPSPSIIVQLPAVLRLKREVNTTKRGLKFSRTNVFSRDGFRCCYCVDQERRDPKELTYDHVLPKSRGGKTVWENIVSSCKPCNRKKGKKTPDEAGFKMHFKPYRPKVLPMSQPFLIAADGIPELWKPYLDAFEQMQRRAG